MHDTKTRHLHFNVFTAIKLTEHIKVKTFKFTFLTNTNHKPSVPPLTIINFTAVFNIDLDFTILMHF